MKRWLGSILPGVVIALAFSVASHIEDSIWHFVALWAAFMLLQIFFVQRFPRAVALEYALKLKPGQKVEAEGK
jgi:hypothetical protein